MCIYREMLSHIHRCSFRFRFVSFRLRKRFNRFVSYILSFSIVFFCLVLFRFVSFTCCGPFVSFRFVSFTYRFIVSFRLVSMLGAE